MSNKDVSEYLNKWFANNKSNPSRWSDNEIGKTIKKNLLLTKNWKNAPRGNPRKGYLMKSRAEKPLTSPSN